MATLDSTSSPANLATHISIPTCLMAIATFSALLTLVGILVSDILYSIVDPRVTQK